MTVDPPRTGGPEDRKGFVRAFVAGITVVPEKLRLDLQVRKIPAALGRDSTCLMVAGARYEPVQKNLEPVERFVVGVSVRRRVVGQTQLPRSIGLH